MKLVAMRKALYILADLDDRDITWLRDAGQIRRVPGGEVIIREGLPIEALYIVIDGKLEVTVAQGTCIAELAAGDIIGEMSFIEKRPPSASVRALTAAKLLAVPQSSVHARLNADAQFAARFYRAIAVFLSDRLRTTVAALGYGAPENENRLEKLLRENELDEGLLDNVHVAGHRMRRLIAMLEGNTSLD
jgi:CRP/FNR family transcriptional regulator, cyclic AMP receptor protein